jgi:hypothetical protein
MSNKDKNITHEGDAPGNVTANVDGYNTKYSFAYDEKSHNKKIKKTATQYGYKMVTNKKKKNFVKFESTFKKIATALFLNEKNISKAE